MDLDLDALAAVGLYDPAVPDAAQRRELLAFLVAEGCTVEEMLHADARGRLFALAGDRIVRPGRDRYTLEQAAALVGADVTVVRRLWRALGLADPSGGKPVASEDDVSVLPVFLAAVDMFGLEAMIALARVMATSLARVGEAASTTVRSVLPEMNVTLSGSEVVTGRAFAETARLVPEIGRVLDVVFRHHLEAVARQFERSDSIDIVRDHSVRYGVGFADLSGFTALSEMLPTLSLSRLVDRFEEVATDVVNDGGGRCVKFIGDAVMFVSPDPGELADIALRLVGHPEARAAGLEVRAGLSFGPLLAQDGDYFGPPVNLAARLVALAEPGTVLAGEGLLERLDRSAYAVEALPPVAVRGFAEPVPAYRLTGRQDGLLGSAEAVN